MSVTVSTLLTGGYPLVNIAGRGPCARFWSNRAVDAERPLRFHQTIGFRLALAFGVVVLLGVGLIVVTVRQFDRVNSAGGEIGQGELQKERFLSRIQGEVLLRGDRLNLGLMEGGSIAPPPADSASFDALTRGYADAHADWAPGERDLYDKLVADLGRLETLEAQASSLAGSGDLAGARALAAGDTLTARRAVLAGINSLSELGVETAVETLDTMHETTDNARVVVVGMGIVAAVLGAGWLYLIARSVTRPISALVAGMRAGEAGDLQTPLSTGGTGEVRRLSLSFDRMRSALAEHVRFVEEEREKTTAILENMADGVLLLDAGGRIMVANRAMAGALGVDPGRLEGAQAADIFRIVEPNEPRPFTVGAPGDEEVLDLQAEVDGSPRRFAASVRRLDLPPAGSLIFVLVLRDVTRARELEQMKSDFVALVSHELRRPVTNLALAAELYRQDAEALPPDHPSRRISDVLTSETARARALVENFLTSARSEAGELKFSPEPADVSRALDDVLSTGGSAGVERVRCALPPDLVAMADPLALQLILHNLVENALKYTPLGSPVEVTGSADGDRVLIAVRDHGPGIPRDQLEHLFERFYRSDSSDARATYGFGLGLYIARKVAEAMGGELRVESTVGRGSVFTLVLPAAAGVRTGGPSNA